MDFLTFLEGLGIWALILGTLTFLAKRVIEGWLAANLEAHKANLGRETAIAVERLKADLRAEEIRFSRVHEKQAEVISSVYAKIEVVHRSFNAWLTSVLAVGVNVEGVGGREEMRRATVRDFIDMRDYFFENGIWLDPASCDALHALLRDFAHVWSLGNVDWVNPEDKMPSTDWIERYERRLLRSIPVAREALDERFREILGVSGQLTATSGSDGPGMNPKTNSQQ